MCLVILALLLALTFGQALDSVERSASKIEAFQAWLSDNGASFDHLEFVRAKGRGISAVAAGDLGRGYTLLYLPNKLIITKDVIEASEVANFFGDESLTDVAALWLLEQLHTPASFWKPYIDILPKKLPHTLMWTEEELEELQATEVRSLSKRRSETVHTKYRALFLAENQKKPLPESLQWMNGVTEDDFKWALATVWMRAFSSDERLGDDVVLLPVEDMFVHMGPEEVEPHIRVRLGESGVEFLTNTDVSKGSLIEKFVGESRRMSNSQLLFQYGFLFDRNPNDHVLVHSPFHTQLPRASIMRQILQAAKCDLEEFQVYTGADYEDVLCVARVTTMTEEELTDAAEVSKATGRRPISEASERRAITALKVLATRRLSFFSTTLELDQSLIDADNSGLKALAPNTRRAVLIRRSEKQIWSTLLQSIASYELKLPSLFTQTTTKALLKDEL